MIDLHLGDCLEVMKQIPDKSVDLVLTDPPYNIARKNNFSTMGRAGIDFGKWDKGFDFLNRKVWLEHKSPAWFWKELHRPPILNFMSYVDELEKEKKSVDLGGNCRLIFIKENK